MNSLVTYNIIVIYKQIYHSRYISYIITYIYIYFTVDVYVAIIHLQLLKDIFSNKRATNIFLE